MIQLLINGKLTDCEILPTPQGVYTERDGIYEFPAFVAIGNGDKPYENDGYMVTCPLLSLNDDGVQPVHTATLYTSLKLDSFIRILVNYPDSFPVVKDSSFVSDDGEIYNNEYLVTHNSEQLDNAVQKILQEMYDHGIVNPPRTAEFIKNKEYRDIDPILKAWKIK